MRFQAIDANDGLPHASVWAIHQDRYGFIWLGTPVGLIQYDGYTFTTYPFEPEDPADYGGRQSLPVHVGAIAELPSGDLLVGSRYPGKDMPALFLFDRADESLRPVELEGGEAFPAGGIRDIAVGKDYAWIASSRMLRIPLHAPGGQMLAEALPIGFGGLQHNYFPAVVRDRAERVWLATSGGFYRWQPDTDTFRFFPFSIPELGEDSLAFRMVNLHSGPEGWMWGTTGHEAFVILFHPETGKQRVVQLREDSRYSSGTHSIMDAKGTIWLGISSGQGGLRLFDPMTGKMTIAAAQVDERLHFPYMRVRSMLEDRSGNIWIGTEQGPLLKYVPQRDQFHWLRYTDGPPHSLSYNYVSGIDQDRNGIYWISTYGGGLNRWDRDKGAFSAFRASMVSANGPLTDLLLGVEAASDGKIWFGEGFSTARFDPVEEEFIHYRESGTTWTVKEDSRGRIWAAKFGNGLRRYDPSQDDFQRVGVPDPENPETFLYTPMSGIYEDRRGHLWLGSHYPLAAGFFRYDPDADTFLVYEDQPEAHAFWEDSQGFVWIASHDGLLRYDPETKEFSRYGERDGLANNWTTTVIEDYSGRLWVGTANGLSCLNQDRTAFRNYHTSDGLPTNQFHSTSYINAEGELFFGGEFGLLYFHPDSLQASDLAPQLAFTGIDLHGEPLSGREGEGLEKSLLESGTIRLAHWQNDLTIHFSALHFKNPAKNRYRVWLENYTDTWREAGTQPFATYTNLDPGAYTFHLQGANSDGVWNEEGISLRMVIAPPWWQTTWAYLLYTILAGGMLYGLYRLQLQRRLEQEEARRMAELDEVKSRLYTNITHEFRTPLTVITGLANLMGGRLKGALKDQAGLIRKNGEQLLRLVNDMLDLAKLEAGALPLAYVQADIIPLLGYLTESFHSLAAEKRIDLRFQSELESLVMDVDPDRLQQVMANLLSNALKFTPEGGEVTVVATPEGPTPSDAQRLVVEVRDTGRGIPPEQIDQLFDRFYQVESGDTRRGEGTGLGLTVVYELVQAMKGTVEVESAVGDGSVFRLRLPVRNEAPLASPDDLPRPASQAGGTPVPGATVSTSTFGPNGDRELVLVVEDNPSLVYYLRTCLENRYDILHAEHGKKGLALALEHLPDIVISDVMMPEMDGFELCRRLKADERSSHIPVILLTARATATDRLVGLQQGADAYLAKPFERRELEARLQQLVALRRRLQEKFGQRPGEESARPANLTPADAREDAFLRRVRQSIQDHLDDADFGVAELAATLDLSRVQVHRKLKALTGQPASLFMRELRLQRARQLLLESDMRVGEVADAVGFRDPSYFTRVYRERFGEVPSERRS